MVVCQMVTHSLGKAYKKGHIDHCELDNHRVHTDSHGTDIHFVTSILPAFDNEFGLWNDFTLYMYRISCILPEISYKFLI